MYIVDRKLGKGGFGQVYVGRRSQATTAKEGIHANQVSQPYSFCNQTGSCSLLCEG